MTQDLTILYFISWVFKHAQTLTTTIIIIIETSHQNEF